MRVPQESVKCTGVRTRRSKYALYLAAEYVPAISSLNIKVGLSNLLQYYAIRLEVTTKQTILDILLRYEEKCHLQSTSPNKRCSFKQVSNVYIYVAYIAS